MGILNHDVRRLIMELLSEMAGQDKLVDLGRGSINSALSRLRLLRGQFRLPNLEGGLSFLRMAMKSNSEREQLLMLLG